MSKGNLLFVIIGASLLTMALLTEGTGNEGGGDSVLHYIYAKYAFQHPRNYFNHWAKPLFTIMASPFAYFGFPGMKLFNAIAAFLTALFTYKVANSMDKRIAFFSVLFIFLMPLNISLIFSGLTEPLFALFTILLVYLSVKKNWTAVAVLVGFMPFVRSEGLIFMCVLTPFLIFQRQWKLLPLLLLGHFLFGLLGLFYYDSILWPFTRIPYQNMTNYGSGDPTDFVVKLLYVIGIPLYIMFWLGLIALPVNRYVHALKTKISTSEFFLVYGLAGAYIIAHSLFWWLGLFHSMGLNRMLIGIAPLLALICARGLFLVHDLIPLKKLRIAWLSIAIIISIIFPFTNNKAAAKREAFQLDSSQMWLNNFALKYKDSTAHYFYSKPYAAIAFEFDPFDKKNNRSDWSGLNSSNLENSIIIWDSWFSIKETGVSLNTLVSNENIIEIERIKDKNGEPTLVIFRSKN